MAGLHAERAYSIISERLSRQGLTIYNYNGTWYMGDPVLGEVELASQEARDLNRQAEDIVDRLRVVESLAGQFRLDALGDWRTNRAEVSPTGRTRNGGSFVTSREREMLDRRAQSYAADRMFDDIAAAGLPMFGPGLPAAAAEAPAPDWADDDATYSTRAAAGLLGISPESVRNRAARLGMERNGRTWQFSRAQVEAMRPQTASDSEAEGEGRSGPGFLDRVSGWLGRLGHSQQGGGSVAGMLLGGGLAMASSGIRATQDTVRAVVGFTENLIAQALGGAFGSSGAALGRIGSGVVNLVVSGLSTGAHLATSLAGVFADVIGSGLRSLGAVAGIAVGGALLGVLVGAVTGIGTALGEAVGSLVGAASQAAEQALSGVVSVLRDLAQTGREFSRHGATMRGIGGVAPGQDLSTLLFARATGVDLSGMFSSWQMRPEFAGARFGAAGAAYDPNNVTGSIVALTDQLRQLPAVLQYPMANAVSGGNGAQMMQLLQLPRERLLSAQGLMSDLGLSPTLLQRILNSLDSTLNLLGALTTGIKLDVLDATLPAIRIGVDMLWGLWREHRTDFRSLMERLPALIGTGLQALLTWGASALDVLGKLYEVTRYGWDWFASNVWPVLASIGAAVRDYGGWGSGGAGEWSAGGGAGGPGGGASPAMRNTAYNRTRQVLRTGGWIMEHPLEALGIGLAAPAVASWGARAVLGNPWARAAMLGGGIGYMGAGIGGNSIGGQAGAGAGSAVLGAGAGFLMGGPIGAIIGGLAATAGGILRLQRDTNRIRAQQAASEAHGQVVQEDLRQRGYLSARGWALQHGYTEAQFDRTGLRGGDWQAYMRDRRAAGRPAGSVLTDLQRRDPVAASLAAGSDWLRRQAERFSAENIRRAIVEGQIEAARQMAATTPPPARIEVGPSREFSLQMADQEGLRLWRNIQLVNA